MKHLFISLGALLAICLSLAGQVPVSGPSGERPQGLRAEAGETVNPPGFFNTTVGILLGTYKSPDSRFAEVFDDTSSFQFGLNLSRTFLYVRGFQLDASVEARLVARTGQATLSGDETRLSMIPVSVAGRLLYQTEYVIPFVGGGGDWYHYSEKSELMDTAGWARGYHVQGGLYIVIPGLEALRVKLYYKFTKVSATANEITVKVGGPEYGVGLAYGFNVLNEAAYVVR